MNFPIKKYTFIFTIVGNMTVFLGRILYWSVHRMPNMRNVLLQMQEAGINSFPVVFLTSFTTGMVMALQFGLVMQRWFGYPIFVGTSVAFSVVKELGPILTAIVMIGRVGAAMTAEIATMKVTEQVDALQTLGVEPIQYLAVPRFLAFIFMLPVLTFLADIISSFGGLVVSFVVLDISPTTYLSEIVERMYINDVMHGLIKAFFFGVVAAWVSIYKGFDCSGGAEGVGKAITTGVVISIVLILVSDYFLSSMLLSMGIGIGGSTQ